MKAMKGAKSISKGTSASVSLEFSLFRFHTTLSDMAPMKSMKAMKAMKSMKAMKGAKSISKGAIADQLAAACELKKSDCNKVLGALAEIAGKEVKSAGKFVITGVCMVKTRLKPATKAGKREMFGKVVHVKAKAAKTVVKAFPVAAIKAVV